MRFWKHAKGAVSIFLVIILVPMMTVSALFVDASKVKLAKGVAASAADLTLNTALTDYDTMLKDVYGLFATAQDTEDLFGRLEGYFRTCITSSGVGEAEAQDYVDQIMAQLGVLAEGDDTADILNMTVTDFQVNKRGDATLANSTMLKKQTVDFMKYRAPIHTGLSFVTSLQSFSTLTEQTKLVEKRQAYYQEQANVMQNAKNAWDEINKYNGSAFVKDSAYFQNMNAAFNSYQGTYERLAKKIIKDLYETQAYAGFQARAYSIRYEEFDIGNEQKETIPAFYTNSSTGARRSLYTEYSTYSAQNPATAENVKTALTNFNSAYAKAVQAHDALMSYNSNTYGLQFLVQTNRGKYYDNWADSMQTLYDRYSAMRHAQKFAGTAEDGTSVMETREALFGASTAQTYTQYVQQFMQKFDTLAKSFNNEFSAYTSTLQGYANNANTDTSSVNAELQALSAAVAGYRSTVKTAKENLDNAVTFLNLVLSAIQSEGSLTNKENEWRSAASDDKLANTSMAQQDLAELRDLADYLVPDDVSKLITRLNNISGNLQKVLEEIDSYTFFGAKLADIDGYETLKNLIKSSVGHENLLKVSTDSTTLEQQASGWVSGKFVVGKAIDVSWENESGTQTILTKETPRFYRYLYSHFNSGEEVSTDTTTKTPNEANGQNLYDSIKSEATKKAEQDAGSNKDSSESSNNLKDREGNPSGGAGGLNVSEDKNTNTETAAADTSKDLGDLIGSLADAVVDLGTDLRDKLYVADYILSMFSYDTIQKELADKNKDDSTVSTTPQTLTLVPIDSSHNWAYGYEVEYIIFGGNNQSNINKAYASIYGIRLGFNLIYAFMDSSIRDTALAIATPISAATLGVLPVPLIQAVIIVAVACCESALDLQKLSNGEAVPLFKNQDSWQLSIKGLFNTVKSEVADALVDAGKTAIDATLDAGLKKLNELLDMTDEQLTAAIQSGEDQVVNAVGTSFDTLIERHANTAIQKLTTLCNDAIEKSLLDPSFDMAASVSAGLDAWLQEEAQGTDTSSDLSYIVKAEAVSIIKESYIQPVLDQLQATADDAQASVADAANALNNLIGSIRLDITDAIGNVSGKVQAYKSEMIDEVRGAMAEGADSLRDTLNQRLDGIFGTSGGTGATGQIKDNTGLSSLMSFRYSTYLRLFLMIALYSGEDGVLLRMADVIQANMAMLTGQDGYRLSNSAVYVELKATVQVKPTLLALPLFAEVEDNPVTNQNWYTIDYYAVKGY